MIGNPAPPTYRMMTGWEPDRIVDRWAIQRVSARPVRCACWSALRRTQPKAGISDFCELDHPVPEGRLRLPQPQLHHAGNRDELPLFLVERLQHETDHRGNGRILHFKQVLRAFHQDWEVLEMQQRNWDDRPVVNTNADAGWIAARRMIEDRAARGSARPRGGRMIDTRTLGGNAMPKRVEINPKWAVGRKFPVQPRDQGGRDGLCLGYGGVGP